MRKFRKAEDFKERKCRFFKKTFKAQFQLALEGMSVNKESATRVSQIDIKQ